jgi:glycerophosphoryl diester phosphodiesterase
MRKKRAFPLVLGHRGLPARYPENTILSFRKALEAGADGIECDVQKCADGRYVIIHDDTVDRTSNGHGALAALSFEELRRLDFGSGERIPSLEEMLGLVSPAAYLDLELKHETIGLDDFFALSTALDRAVPRSRLMISSFQPSLLYPFRRAGYTVGFLLGEEAYARGAGAIARELMRLRPQFVNLPVQTLDRIGVRRTLTLLKVLEALGMNVLWWTVNDLKSVEAALRFSRILVSDDPEGMVRAMAAFGAGPE